jgi:hypothetical protein
MPSPNTGVTLSAQSPESVRILWQKEVDLFEQTTDPFMKYEGSSKDSPIRVINDTSVRKGLKFRITSRAGYYGRGKSGDDMFQNTTDFEQDVINNNEVDADYLRDATSITQRTDEYLGTLNEIANGQAAELGKWMGREKAARMGMTYRLKGGPSNFLIGGGKSSSDLLKTADGLVYNDILLMGQALKPMGGRPCEMATIKGVPVYKYCVMGTTPGLFSLKQDSDYKDLLKNAAPREAYDENPLWTGGYMDIDGHRIEEFNPIDPDGYAWSGSWFNPKAYLGGAITAGTSTFTILGGGSATAGAITNIDYFRFFSNFAFPFLPNDVYVPSTNTRYLLIINPRGAVTALNPYPGLIGMYAWTTGNNGNTITITQRLGPTTAGAQVSTLGQVTWNSGVWAGLHTEVHPEGATIVECNQYGVATGDTLMFGAMSALRGYGQFRNHRSTWELEGGFETRTYITTVFGQALAKNVNNKYPGFVIMKHALNYPELGLPVVP